MARSPYVCGHCAVATTEEGHTRCPGTIPSGVNVKTGAVDCNCQHPKHNPWLAAETT